MPIEVYEVVAQGARYWFLFLMVLIVWRSYRWYAKDRKQRKKRLRLLPDAGYIGEMVVIRGNEALEKGAALPVPGEGTLGYSRMNDLCIPVAGVAKRHCRLTYAAGEGLMLYPCPGKTVKVDDQEAKGGRHPLTMAHGSRLYVGEAELRLRMFAGFDSPAALRDQGAHAHDDPAGGSQPEVAPSAMTPQQLALWQQHLLMQQQYMQQMTYMQWMANQQMAARQAASQAEPQPAEAAQPDTIVYDEDGSGPEDEQALTDVQTMEGARPFDYAPPGGQIDFQSDAAFYPPTLDDEDDGSWPYAAYPPADSIDDGSYAYPEYAEDEPLDEDMTDAAVPPRSAYLGHDEAEEAKRQFWDRYLGGGGKP